MAIVPNLAAVSSWNMPPSRPLAIAVGNTANAGCPSSNAKKCQWSWIAVAEKACTPPLVLRGFQSQWNHEMREFARLRYSPASQAMGIAGEVAARKTNATAAVANAKRRDVSN